MLGVIPLSALFILFDFVVHNPSHPETSTNLALLDVAGGYFSRLEYATGGSLPSSILSDFAHIARQFVRDINPDDRIPNEIARYTPYLSTKPYEGIPSDSQPMTYLPTHLVSSVLFFKWTFKLRYRPNNSISPIITYLSITNLLMTFLFLILIRYTIPPRIYSL
jgi:hypothetical protein